MSRYITRDYKTYNTIIKDCPIILKKTRILYDKETNIIILQIALNNLSNKEIKKITFSITTYDIENAIIDKEETIVIEEKIKEDSEYSIKKPIIFKDKNINYVDVKIKEVIYIDNLTWRNTKTKLEKEINKPKIIYTESDLYKTLCFNNIKFIKKCYPEFNDNYWRCSCTKLNLYSNEKCRLCNAPKEELKTFFEYKTIENLIEQYKEFCAKEKKKKLNKIFNILKIILLILIIFFLIITINLCIKNINYNKALTFYKDKNYTESIKILERQDNDNSKNLLSNVYYDYGYYLLENEEYSKAIEYFKKTSRKEKKLSINEARYRQGLKFFDEKNYFSALKSFDNISVNNYKDADNYLKNIIYTYITEYAKYWWKQDNIILTDEELNTFKEELPIAIEDLFKEENQDDLDEVVDWLITLDDITIENIYREF